MVKKVVKVAPAAKTVKEVLKKNPEFMFNEDKVIPTKDKYPLSMNKVSDRIA